MKKGIVIAVGLIVLGLIFECLHFATNMELLGFKFWVLGIASIFLGILGLLWYMVVPLLENRAAKLGKFKKKQLKSSDQVLR